MSNCKCQTVKIYDGEHRCMKCFEQFEPARRLKAIQKGIVALVQQEKDDYAPNEPPHHINEFLEALEEVMDE